jgi:hypothetical protein
VSQDPIIRAGEVGQYAYCARAWWLSRVKGIPSANVAALRRGEARHRDHGHAVESYHRLRRLAVLLFMLAGAALIAWLFLGLGG